MTKFLQGAIVINMNMFSTFLLMIIFVATLIAPAYGFNIIHNYETTEIKIFKTIDNKKLTLEIAHADDPRFQPIGISRIQIRDEYGKIIALTPSRIEAIPLCFNAKNCWVFMWKTVYPFPAIFKFNPDQTTWMNEANPPMQYSNIGRRYVGFNEHFNLLFGIIGLVMMFFKHAWYFCTCILLAIILCLQISKYRDLPETKQKWIKTLLSMIFLPTHLPFTLEPYTITTILLCGFMIGSIYMVGVPHVISACFVMTSFFVTAIRLAKIKRDSDENNP